VTLIDKDIKKLVKACGDQGFTVRYRKSGHPAIYRLDGSHIVDLASTPSEYRGWANALAKLKRAGLVWPPKR
jgi:hypothetical protein